MTSGVDGCDGVCVGVGVDGCDWVCVGVEGGVGGCDGVCVGVGGGWVRCGLCGSGG